MCDWFWLISCNTRSYLQQQEMQHNKWTAYYRHQWIIIRIPTHLQHVRDLYHLDEFPDVFDDGLGFHLPSILVELILPRALDAPSRSRHRQRLKSSEGGEGSRTEYVKQRLREKKVQYPVGITKPPFCAWYWSPQIRISMCVRVLYIT